MRNTRTLSAVLITVLCCPFLLQAQEPQEPRKITVVAKKYEFQPSKIELKAGEPVEITFTSEDTKHGFECPELNLKKVIYEKDKPATVAFTPDKPGTYPFKCAKFCGFGHGKMKGEFVVVAP
jgi:heme/copper-type cytochrome/quinol oxidase subunit 2